MPTVRVARSNEYMNKFRRYNIYIDGVKVGAVGNGETADYPVAAGTHIVCAKIGIGSSEEHTVEVSGSNIVTFNVGLPKNRIAVMGVAIALIILRPFLARYVNEQAVLIGYMALTVLYLVYIFTLGRKKQLLMTRDTSTNDYVPYANK